MQSEEIISTQKAGKAKPIKEWTGPPPVYYTSHTATIEVKFRPKCYDPTHPEFQAALIRSMERVFDEIVMRPRFRCVISHFPAPIDEVAGIMAGTVTWSEYPDGHGISDADKDCREQYRRAERQSIEARKESLEATKAVK